MQSFESVANSALQLDITERLALADRLLDSVDEMPRDIQKAWESELQARSEAIKNGTLETYSKEEVLANL